MILDSRTDVETWFLEEFYRIKAQEEEITQDISISLL